jgi:2-methylcitrate dehydratase
VAYNIIGGGEEGDKTRVRTKEEADHSLHYMLAAAVLDDQVMPVQYRPERIGGEDIQSLLRKITVHPDAELSRRFPEEMACRLKVTLRVGRVLVKEKKDYEGFHTRPMSFQHVARKFDGLAGVHADAKLRADIIQAVESLESIRVSELVALLANAR